MNPTIIANGIVVVAPTCPVCGGPLVAPVRCTSPDELVFPPAGDAAGSAAGKGADFRAMWVCRRHLLCECAYGPLAAVAQRRVWEYAQRRRRRQRRETVFRPVTRWARLRWWLARLLLLTTREDRCRVAELRRIAQMRVCYPVWSESEN